MNVMDYVRSALRHWLIILLAGVLAAASGLLFGRSQPPQFQTHARFVISPSPAVTDDNNIAQTLDALANKRAIVSTFAQVVLSQRSFDVAARGVNATLREAERVKISTVVSPEANVVEVFVIGPRPQLIEQMLELLGTESTTSFEALYKIYAVEALDVAGPKTEQVAPKPVRSALVGGVLGGAIAFLVGLVDDAVKAGRANAGRAGAPEKAEPGAATPEPEHPEEAPVAGLPARAGPEAADHDGEPGKAMILHPTAPRYREPGSIPARTTYGPTSDKDIFEDPGRWLRELDGLDREVRQWPDRSSTDDLEDAQQRWRHELDDLSWMLRAWTEGGHRGSEGDGRPDAPSAT